MQNPGPHLQAKLHQARGETDKAAHYYRTNLERIEAENISGSDQLDALLYLAEYAKVGSVCLVTCRVPQPWHL